VVAAAPADQPSGRAAGGAPIMLRIDTMAPELAAVRQLPLVGNGKVERSDRATRRAVGRSVPSEFLNGARALLATVLGDLRRQLADALEETSAVVSSSSPRRRSALG
jgi:hypothetical protein